MEVARKQLKLSAVHKRRRKVEMKRRKSLPPKHQRRNKARKRKKGK
jgi:hypothetical protein